MSVLAIDSSARHRLAVVLADRGGGLLASRVTEGSVAVPALDRAIRDLLREGVPEAVVVVTGPGSYTGLRAGMAAALGVAHAAGIPLFGTGSLEVVARAAGRRGALLAVADAGRGAAYACAFMARGLDLRALGEPHRVPLPEVAGEGCAVVSLDPLPGARVGGAAGGLARAVPAALARPPLGLAGLRGTYLA